MVKKKNTDKTNLARKKKNTISADATRVKEITDELLGLMGVEAHSEVKEDKKSDLIAVDIQTESEPGIIIGSRGRTLNSIQTILGMMYKHKTGEWKRISVDIAGWREKEEGRLERLAEQTAERVKQSGEEQFLYNLNSSQRRVIHLKLVDDKDVETESIGEGRDRYLVVRPRK